MTSPRRRQDSPVESLTLKITFRADRDSRAKIMDGVPWARFRQGTCEVRIDGSQPLEVAEKAKRVLETIRAVSSKSKGFK